MIVQVVQGQRKGKTAILVGVVLWLMGFGGYEPWEVCSNQTIKIDGVSKFTNAQLRAMMKVMIEKNVTHKVTMVAEADRAFPPRFWHDREQSHALIGLQQDEKRGCWFIYDCHWHGVDVLLEDATQIYIVPEYVPVLDTIYCEIISKVDMIPHGSYEVTEVSKRLFPYYDTHEPVD